MLYYSIYPMLPFSFLGDSGCSVSLTFLLHYFFSPPVFVSSANLISNDFWLCFFFPARLLETPKCNLCGTPSATLPHSSESLFKITFWNLSVSQLLIHLMLCLLYWFYIIRVSWSKYYMVLSQMPYRNLTLLHYCYYFYESDLLPHQKRQEIFSDKVYFP